MKRDENQTTPLWLSLNWELIGEGVLLGMATALMLTMIVESYHWKPGSALMPRIAASAGLFFVVLRIVAIVRGRRKQTATGRIMDIGFTGVEDTKLALRRFAQSAGALIVLVLGILTFGWEVALPTWIFGYMMLFSGQKWYWAVIAGGAFELVIRFIYDDIFATIWNEPWIVQLWHSLIR